MDRVKAKEVKANGVEVNKVEADRAVEEAVEDRDMVESTWILWFPSTTQEWHFELGCWLFQNFELST